MGAWGASVSTVQSNVRSSGLQSFDIPQRLLFEQPVIFWTPRDPKNGISLPSSIRRIIQPKRVAGAGSRLVTTAAESRLRLQQAKGP